MAKPHDLQGICRTLTEVIRSNTFWGSIYLPFEAVLYEDEIVFKPKQEVYFFGIRDDILEYQEYRIKAKKAIKQKFKVDINYHAYEGSEYRFCFYIGDKLTPRNLTTGLTTDESDESDDLQPHPGNEEVIQELERLGLSSILV